jgi:hypothetical protein
LTICVHELEYKQRQWSVGAIFDIFRSMKTT